MNSVRVCGLCQEHPPAVGLIDYGDPLARRLGQTPVPMPLCVECLGRTMTARRQRDFSVQAMSALETLSLGLPKHESQVHEARCVTCDAVERILYRLSGEPWDGLPQQLCCDCLGTVVVMRLGELDPGTYPVAIQPSQVQPPVAEQSTFWRTILGAYELENRPAIADAKYVGDISCSYPYCGKTLARVSVLGQEIVVVSRAPFIDGMCGVPNSAAIGYTGYARFGPIQETNIATVVACWGGHGGLVIDYELCRDLVKVASRGKRGRVRLPARRQPSSPSVG